MVGEFSVADEVLERFGGNGNGRPSAILESVTSELVKMEIGKLPQVKKKEF